MADQEVQHGNQPDAQPEVVHGGQPPVQAVVNVQPNGAPVEQGGTYAEVPAFEPAEGDVGADQAADSAPGEQPPAADDAPAEQPETD